MSKKVVAKYIFIFFCAIALLAFAVFATVYHCSNGSDYTEEYTVYKQVKDIKTLDSLREKLQELKLEYEITDKALSLNDYKNVSFSIHSDDSCSIATNTKMYWFEQLDTENRSTMIIRRTLQNDKITEKFIIERDVFSYIKQNNHYFFKFTIMMVFGAASYFLTALILALYVPAFIKDIREAKKA